MTTPPEGATPLGGAFSGTPEEARMSKTVVVYATNKLTAVLLALIHARHEGLEVESTSTKHVSGKRWEVTLMYRPSEPSVSAQ